MSFDWDEDAYSYLLRKGSKRLSFSMTLYEDQKDMETFLQGWLADWLP